MNRWCLIYVTSIIIILIKKKQKKKNLNFFDWTFEL